MKLLYCVQRYGEQVGGGAESACRMLAERMAARGHRVEVVTSCAREYTTWANEYPEGASELNGVTVHRLPVRAERTTEQFGPLSSRVLGSGHASLAVEHDWVRVQGPDLPGLEPWLEANAGRFDAAIFYTYLYAQSALGLPVAARHTATVLHPAAHDEPMMDLRVFERSYRAADAVSVHTPEEAETLRRRFRHGPPTVVVGLGVEMHPPAADAARFREHLGITDEGVLLYVGRIEPGKATDDLARYFAFFRERVAHPMKLVMVGPVIQAVVDHPDIICTGFVDEQTRLDAYAASDVFVMPSHFESFSISLCDAWVIRKPALVNGNCAVLNGQAHRSGGALGYRDYAEFESALSRLLGDPGLRISMGEQARNYVLDQYDWGVVLDRYEDVLRLAIEGRRRRFGGMPCSR